MNAVQSVINKNPLTKKTALFGLGILLSLSMFSTIRPQKASAAWVNQRSFNYSILSSYCGNSLNGYTMYPVNYTNRPDEWNCFPKNGVTPLPFWIRPGDTCKRAYGSTYSFLVTNWGSAYGGYCAQWR